MWYNVFIYDSLIKALSCNLRLIYHIKLLQLFHCALPEIIPEKRILLGGKKETTIQYCDLLYELGCMRLLVRFALAIFFCLLLIAIYEYSNIRRRVVSRNDSKKGFPPIFNFNEFKKY